jgi:hypothetical protein
VGVEFEKVAYCEEDFVERGFEGGEGEVGI